MIIEIEGLWKRYGRFDAVRGISLAAPEGSVFALIGANGAGKTTTIKTMMNIIEPDRGSARILGVDSRRLSPRELAQIGYVSENQEMPESLSVAAFMGYLRPFYPTWDQALEASILDQMQLPPERRIGRLSHGMRMKLALSAALPFRPKLLVLDEPFSGLDPLVRDELMQGLLAQSYDTTMLISSHELEELEGVATHVAFIDHGQLLFQEPMADLTDRVRQVRVTVAGDARLPAGAPETWLDMAAAGSVVSFVDTRFDEARLRAQIASLLGEPGRVEIQPLPLRSIFTAIARSTRRKDA